jgi:8-oxo-dGTP pyrophosphatase MutT (NUDIX family)
MTTLGSLLKPAPQAPDIPTLAASVAYLTAAGASPGPLGSGPAILASLAAWTQQDDDAHDRCSLTACRDPLHPGPCKGWKGLLHDVSPGTYRQLEDERVRKANERRVKRIADLRSANKPIPRRLLAEIKAKPAPNHPAHNAQPVPLGQVNQKADLAGGQAHTAGQAVSKAAGVQVKQAPPLPLGPKKQKPTVAGRGPAFVITQPKVTDQYKLDKAAKITPQEWAGLSDADKATIRNEITAIKARGFGPQQTKSDELLAKLPAPTVGQTLKPGAPGTITTPKGNVHQVVNPAPGKVTLGQAVKTPQLAAPAPSTGKGQRDQNGILVKAQPGGSSTTTSVGLPNGYRISRDGMGYSLKHNGKLIRTGNDQKALEQYAHDHAKGNTAGHTPSVADDLLKAKAANAPAAPAPVPPSAPTPAVLPAHAQAARAVAARTFGGAPTSKKHLTAYGKLSKDDFEHLDAKTQATIRDDLANAKAKFLDPKKKQEAADLLDRFGSRHPAPVPAPAAIPAAHQGTLDKIASGKKVATYGNGDGTVNPGLQELQKKGLITWNAKDGQFDLTPEGRKLATPAAAHPKGYSDPQNEVVKAATSGLIDTDKVLQTVARLSPDQMGKLDDTDRKAVLGRLAFIATHPKGDPGQKAKAAAYGRIINGGTHVPATVKFDHTPSIGELHAEEQKGGHAAAFAAIAAARDTTMDRDARIKALAGLTKAQFQALPADEQRQITDALHELHIEKTTTLGGTAKRSAEVEQAFDTYTGMHPGIHRLKQAEADFRAGKLDTKAFGGFHKELLGARVQSPGSSHNPGTPGDLLEKEAQRIAEDNPALPHWLRATMIDNKYGAPGRTYDSVSAAENPFNWEDAPRLSSSDIANIFRADVDHLANVHPIQAEAVKALREHIIATGLKGQPGVPSGSPWSTSTRNHVVDNLLNVSSSQPEVSPERLKEFDGLPSMSQVLVRRVLTERLNAQTDDHAKVRTFITLHALERRTQHSQEQTDALKAASDTFTTPSDVDVYRKLDPAQYDELPPYARKAITAHLAAAQQRAERSGPVATWTPQSNPLKEFPGALNDHLNGMRTAYPDRRTRNASDIANFGTKIINPFDRNRVYSEVPIAHFRTMTQGDQDLIHADLDKIAHDAGNPLPVRYGAQFTKDFQLSTPTHFSLAQIVAVGATNPAPGTRQSDTAVENSLAALDKAEFDKLDPVYRAAIDARIQALPGAGQQALTAKFHPQAPQAANPSGMTPTSVQANVPPHVQAALDTIYGTHPKSHTMAHQLSTYGTLRGSDFQQLNGQEQGHLLGDLSFIATTAKGPSADKAKKLIDRFTPAGTPSGHVPTGAVIPPANAVPGQVRYATPLKGLEKAKDSGTSGDGWISLPGGGRVWGAHGAAGLLLMHQDKQTGEKRYLMVQRGPAISDPGKWTFPGGASDSKETPHQGAARETIEELGLKDDALKDALIHGDHTFSVPNHTWKYTTVAAEVPTMIKPNLSTAHARAETSDAKWMTLDEIKALDKAGSLHHPIAGGKLEQNVISLYPPAGGQKLGQVARPGPVTKRQGRLYLPPAGRQAPGGPPNAWTAPHKKSTGKNLVGDKTSIDKIRQDVKQARSRYDGKTADGRLAAIGNMQGFDDTPTVASKKEVDRLLATGDYVEVWRGVKGSGRWAGGGKSAEAINEDMRSGNAYYGKGIFGNGYYLATQKSVAEQYSDHSKNSILRALIPKSAITEHYDKVEREAHAASSPTSKAKGANSWEEGTLYDPGRWAAAKGVDGIEIQSHHTSGGGWARHVAKPGQPAYNWLNRSVLIIQEAQ